MRSPGDVNGGVNLPPQAAQIMQLTMAAREHIDAVYDNPGEFTPPPVGDPAEFLYSLPDSQHGSSFTVGEVTKMVADTAQAPLAQLLGVSTRLHLLEALRSPHTEGGRRGAMYETAKAASRLGQQLLSGGSVSMGERHAAARAEVRSAAGRLALHEETAKAEQTRDLFRNAARDYKQAGDMAGATRNSLYRALHERSIYRGMAAYRHIGSAAVSATRAIFSGQGKEAFGYMRRIVPHLRSTWRAARGISDYRTV